MYYHKELEKILFNILPNIMENTLIYNNIDIDELIKRIELVEDQEFIRNKLKNKKLVAFIANNSILPRESGISQKPLRNGKRFKSPKN